MSKYEIDLIKALQQNWRPFGGMSEDMQAKAKELGLGVFDQWLGGVWFTSDANIFAGCFGTATAYRLRSDYKEVKCKTCNDSGKVPSVHPHDDAYYGENRPCPDCQEKPEIVEYLVFTNGAGANGSDDKGSLMYSKKSTDANNIFLWKALTDPDFIGFKYEDGYVCTESRRYLDSRGTTSVLATLEELTQGDLKVLTPTHVLFKAKK